MLFKVLVNYKATDNYKVNEYCDDIMLLTTSIV